MPALSRSVQILVNTNLQTAFDYVSDLTKHPEWSGGELKLDLHFLFIRSLAIRL
jgi:hypothetical protein